MWKKRANNRLAGKILHADASELEGIRTAVMERYQKLYPDWEILYLTIPKHNMEERRKTVETIIKMLQKQYL